MGVTSCLGPVCRALVHPDDVPVVGEAIGKAWLHRPALQYPLEHRFIYADGGVGYISVNIQYDPG